MADQSNKTEKPTPRRLEKAKREGQVLTSREFLGGLQFVVFIALLNYWGGHWVDEMRKAVRFIVQIGFQPSLTTRDLVRVLQVFLAGSFFPLAAGGLVIMAVTFGAHSVITRLNLSLKKLQPDIKRLVSLKRLRSLPAENTWQLVQAAGLLVMFAWIIYLVTKSRLEMLFSLPLADLSSGLHGVSASFRDLLWKMAGVFVFFGIADLLRQRRRFQGQMKMSRQDIMDELKESEGHPQTKMRFRRLRRDLQRRRMMRDIATATAVVVNPTHYAVAIRYRYESMSAPLVVAKGKNYLALRIRQKAIENFVPLVENAPLAQTLYKSVEVGQEIPPHLYRAVAEILAYIHRLTHGTLAR